MPDWTERRLLDEVLDHLREGPDSISGLARRLAAGRERPLHRLTVAGYLMALADLGLVREGERPPSKVYRLTHGDTARDAHGYVGRIVREDGHAGAAATALGAAALHLLFQRPVFRAELRHAGLDGPIDGLTTTSDEADRRAVRATLQRRAHPRIPVPRGDPLLVPDATPQAVRVVCRALLEATHCDHLSAAPTPRQAALDEA